VNLLFAGLSDQVPEISGAAGFCARPGAVRPTASAIINERWRMMAPQPPRNLTRPTEILTANTEDDVRTAKLLINSLFASDTESAVT
jgi:hypothetical protein